MRLGKVIFLVFLLSFVAGASAQSQPCQAHFGARWAWPPNQPYTGSTPLELARLIQNRVLRVYLDDLKLGKRYPSLCLDEDSPQYVIVWETGGFRMVVNRLESIQSQTTTSGQIGDDQVRLNQSNITWVPVQVPSDTFIETVSVYQMDASGCLNAPAVFAAVEYSGNPERAAKKALKKALEYLAAPAKAPAQPPILCFPPERIGAVKP